MLKDLHNNFSCMIMSSMDTEQVKNNNLQKTEIQPVFINVMPISESSVLTSSLLRKTEGTVLDLLYKLGVANPKGGKVVYLLPENSAEMLICIGYPSDKHRDILRMGSASAGLSFTEGSGFYGGGFFTIDWNKQEVTVEGFSDSLDRGIESQFRPQITEQIKMAVERFLAEKSQAAEIKLESSSLPGMPGNLQ